MSPQLTTLAVAHGKRIQVLKGKIRQHENKTVVIETGQRQRGCTFGVLDDSDLVAAPLVRAFLMFGVFIRLRFSSRHCFRMYEWRGCKCYRYADAVMLLLLWVLASHTYAYMRSLRRTCSATCQPKIRSFVFDASSPIS